MYYNGKTLPEICVDVIDTESGFSYQTLNDVKLSNEYIVWMEPNISLKDKNLSLRFYKDKTITKIKL